MGVAGIKDWKQGIVKDEEIDKYLVNGKDYIDDQSIFSVLKRQSDPDPVFIRDILQKSLSITTLNPDETAALLQVKDAELWQEINKTALEVKRKVYDNRIVFFAPLYCANHCVNNCAYCGFREANNLEVRRILTMEEVKQETISVLREGHKRLILVFGEHPSTDVDYMVDCIKAVYSVNDVAPKSGQPTNIRRVNINAAPMEMAKLKKLKEAGIGTYQVFQEGQTFGIFQFESSGMRDILRKARPQRLEDLIALNALYRPGPLRSGMVDDYVARKQGRTEVTYELPELEPILAETYGVIAYQEQVMRISNVVGGFTLGEADILRKAMGKKSAEGMQEQRAKFVEGAKEGFSVAIRIIPYLVAILVAIGMFRGGGGIDLLTRWLKPALDAVYFPTELLPLALMRSLSGSGSLGIFTDLVKTLGPDHLVTRMAATIYGSSETTFYVIAVYFGSVGVHRTRHAVPAGLIADVAGIIASIIICRLILG